MLTFLIVFNVVKVNNMYVICQNRPPEYVRTYSDSYRVEERIDTSHKSSSPCNMNDQVSL